MNVSDLNILVTGACGQLGEAVSDALTKAAIRFTALSHNDLDITDAAAVTSVLRHGAFSHIINCAAYTAVDRAEEEKALAFAINCTGVENIARAAEEFDVRILHISTDYVFDGSQPVPYSEADLPRPLNVYGTSKRRGETALLGLSPSAIIIRTGWLYCHGHRNFVSAIIDAARKGRRIEVVVDQAGTPTYAADLADAVVKIIRHPQWTPGIYNYSNEGVASRYDFAVAVLNECDMSDAAAAVVPIRSADYPSPATRPAYAVLDKNRIRVTYGVSTPHWQEALHRCLNPSETEA